MTKKEFQKVIADSIDDLQWLRDRVADCNRIQYTDIQDWVTYLVTNGTGLDLWLDSYADDLVGEIMGFPADNWIGRKVFVRSVSTDDNVETIQVWLEGVQLGTFSVVYDGNDFIVYQEPHGQPVAEGYKMETEEWYVCCAQDAIRSSQHIYEAIAQILATIL